ncbi:hypothetical protein [Streptomyces sp. NPDC049555]|uniref:hypothetical protein n=1 Tax=Streptomyces sp. NPDC049555 TaxID=3154930 RepID=UPI00343EB838
MGPLHRRIAQPATTPAKPPPPFKHQHIPEHTISTTTRALATLGCTALLATATVACNPLGDDGPGPAAKVKNAFTKLGQQHAMTATVHLDATADQIYTAMSGKKDFARGDADMLAGLQLTYGVSTDKALKDITGRDDDSINASVAITRNGHQPLLEARSAANKLYARADLKDLGDLARQADKHDGNDTDMATLEQMARHADELPASMNNVKAALKGGWFTLDPDDFPDDGDSPTAELDAKEQKKVLDALSKAIASNANFKDAGKAGGADHVKATIPAKKTAQEITDTLKPLSKQLGDRFTRLSRDVRDVPEQDVTVDVAIRDGMVSGLTLDLAQFDHKIKGELPLVVDLNGNAGKVDVPADAKPLTPADIMAAAMFTYRDQAPAATGHARV